MNVCITPAGAWGTALALHLVRRGHTVTLVPHRLEEALELASVRENRAHLPGLPFPGDLQIGLELAPSLMEAEVLVLAPPAKHLREVARQAQGARHLATALRAVLSLCKGLEEGTDRRPSQVIHEELPGLAPGTISGPTFARQVAEGRPSAAVLALDGPAEMAVALQEAFSGPGLRLYTSPDLAGVELGGCLKNVYALAAGMCDGLELGDNSKSALLTRALHEMIRVGQLLGGQPETFYGLSGFGDLVLTCYGEESRNRRFGEDLARGRDPARHLNEQKLTVEGHRTSHAFHHLCQREGIDAPILAQIYRILHEDLDPRTALGNLMGRSLKPER